MSCSSGCTIRLNSSLLGAPRFGHAHAHDAGSAQRAFRTAFRTNSGAMTSRRAWARRSSAEPCIVRRSASMSATARRRTKRWRSWRRSATIARGSRGARDQRLLLFQSCQRTSLTHTGLEIGLAKVAREDFDKRRTRAASTMPASWRPNRSSHVGAEHPRRPRLVTVAGRRIPRGTRRTAAALPRPRARWLVSFSCAGMDACEAPILPVARQLGRRLFWRSRRAHVRTFPDRNAYTIG